MLLATASKYLYDIYNEWYESPHILLDPITTITRLAILQYKPNGTKISIQPNKITYMENNFYQGTLRMFHGDQREDLKNLYKPLVVCVKWFGDRPDIDIIVKEAINGISKLRETYSETCTIYHTLTHYKTILEYCLDKKPIDKLVDSLMDLNDKPLDDILSLWKDEEIKIIASFLKNFVYYCDNEDLTALHLEPLEKLLETKENILNNILNTRIGHF